jgi:hypothetical protein
VVARVTVNPANQAPTDIALSNTSVAENSPLGTTNGTLSTTDPDAGDTHTYSLVANFGDNTAFTIEGTALKTNTAARRWSPALGMVSGVLCWSELLATCATQGGFHIAGGARRAGAVGLAEASFSLTSPA